MLILTSGIYFISGEIGNVIFLMFALILVSSLRIYQDLRNNYALENSKVLPIKNAKWFSMAKLFKSISKDLIVGDSLLVEEGSAIGL